MLKYHRRSEWSPFLGIVLFCFQWRESHGTCPKSQSGAIKLAIGMFATATGGRMSFINRVYPTKSLIYSYPEQDFFHPLLQDIFYRCFLQEKMSHCQIYTVTFYIILIVLVFMFISLPLLRLTFGFLLYTFVLSAKFAKTTFTHWSRPGTQSNAHQLPLHLPTFSSWDFSTIALYWKSKKSHSLKKLEFKACHEFEMVVQSQNSKTSVTNLVLMKVCESI